MLTVLTYLLLIAVEQTTQNPSGLNQQCSSLWISGEFLLGDLSWTQSGTQICFDEEKLFDNFVYRCIPIA